MPEITCSSLDKGWSFKLPKLGAADQQSVEVAFSVDIEELTKIFVFDSESLTLTLEPKYEAQLVKGNLCPVFDKAFLEFELVSNVLGTSTQKFELNQNIQAQGEEVRFFEFNYDWQQALIEQQAEVQDFQLPSVEIASISKTGEVKIKFSDTFLVYPDLKKIRKDEMMVLRVAPEEDQEEDKLRFDWRVISFTE